MTGWAYYHVEYPRCEICGGDYMAQTHHIIARGRKGTEDNSRENLITLCAQHHTEAHSLGRVKFPAKYGLEERWAKAFEERKE